MFNFFTNSEYLMNLKNFKNYAFWYFYTVVSICILLDINKWSRFKTVAT